jgi:hypothetical protein
MKFRIGAIMKALARQYDGEGMGIPCARCGKYLDTLKRQDEEWIVIPRIPVEHGG